jgi:hypothetical protein
LKLANRAERPVPDRLRESQTLLNKLAKPKKDSEVSREQGRDERLGRSPISEDFKTQMA